MYALSLILLSNLTPCFPVNMGTSGKFLLHTTLCSLDSTLNATEPQSNPCNHSAWTVSQASAVGHVNSRTPWVHLLCWRPQLLQQIPKFHWNECFLEISPTPEPEELIYIKFGWNYSDYLIAENTFWYNSNRQVLRPNNTVALPFVILLLSPSSSLLAMAHVTIKKRGFSVEKAT